MKSNINLAQYLICHVLKITKFVADLKSTKRRGTIIKLQSGLKCTIESFGLIWEVVSTHEETLGPRWNISEP